MSMLSKTEENDPFSLPTMCLITLYDSLVYLVSSLDNAGSPFIRSFKSQKTTNSLQKSAPCNTGHSREAILKSGSCLPKTLPG